MASWVSFSRASNVVSTAMSLCDAIVVSVPRKAKLSAPFDFQGLWDRLLSFCRIVVLVLLLWYRSGDARIKGRKDKRIIIVVIMVTR
jgi:hypothetical protein